MTKRRVEREIDEAYEELLRGLSPQDRLRRLIKVDAEGDTEEAKRLFEFAPKQTYSHVEQEFLDAFEDVHMASWRANWHLDRCVQFIYRLECQRDRFVALALLNGALSKADDGAWSVDERGRLSGLEEVSEGTESDEKFDDEVSFLATKYRELWSELGVELLLDDEDRSHDPFADLATTGLIGYPLVSDDESPIDLMILDAERRLCYTVAEFYRWFHGWRLFAEEHLEVTFDEFIRFGRPDADRPPGMVMADAFMLDEETCDHLLSLYGAYLESYPELIATMAERFDDIDGPDDPADVDLDAQLEVIAEAIADELELPE